MTSVTLFSVAILLIFAVAAFIEIFRGLQRGWLKTLITLANVVLSLILSVLLSPRLATLIAEPIFDEIRWQSFYRSLPQEIQALGTLMEALLAIVISSLLFAILFFLIRALIALITAIVYKSALKPREDRPGFEKETQTWADRNTKPLSALLGTVSALLVSMAITAPLMGTLDVAMSVIGIAERSARDVWDTMPGSEEVVEDIKLYSHDIPGNVLYQLGGKYMYRAVASTEINDHQVYAVNELEILEDAAEDFLTVLPVLKDPTLATDEHIESLNSLCDHLEQMHISDVMLAGFLPIAADAWLDGKLVMTIPKPVMNELIEPSFDEMLRVCADSTEDNACQNTVTMLRIYGIILQSDLLMLESFDYDTVMRYLDESDIITQLNAELNRNPYMFSVKERIVAIAMEALVSRINAEHFGEQKYETLLENLAEAVQTVQTRGYGTDEEKMSVMASYVHSYLENYGFTPSTSLIELAAEELLSVEHGMGQDITAEDIKEFLNAYTQ